MKKDLATLATLGLLAGICLSANSNIDGKEIAMLKCSKDNSAKSSCNGQSSCKSQSEEEPSETQSQPEADQSSCSGQSGCNGSTSHSDSAQESSTEANSSLLMQAKRKAAAEKLAE
ncbi:MAG TPA: hypothetical protein VHL30_04235 [Chlamydiales bacterium]|jgi:hypothetical protein|nr:hypothetical protein [Chlamydiales bacterium]